MESIERYQSDHMHNGTRIGVKLDHTEEETFSCRRESVERGSSSSPPPCNGHSDFCSLNFASFTFAGTHNAGTGQSDYRILHCAAKNQVTEREPRFSLHCNILAVFNCAFQVPTGQKYAGHFSVLMCLLRTLQ